MQMQISDNIIIDVPADKVWQIAAHQFGDISRWASALSESQADHSLAAPVGASCGGRVCTAPGFGDIQERFSHYDEGAKRFGYVARQGMPSFVTRAENNWTVEAISATQSRIKIRAVIALKLIPGLLLLPLFKFQMKRLAKQTMAELKYYAEHDQPHPRKQKQLEQAMVGT